MELKERCPKESDLEGEDFSPGCMDPEAISPLVESKEKPDGKEAIAVVYQGHLLEFQRRVQLEDSEPGGTDGTF